MYTKRFILTARLCALALALSFAGAQAQDLVVDPAGPVPTITEALARAHPGDRIVIRAGLYREPTLIVDKPLTLVGEAGAILDGQGDRQIMTVLADGVTVRGLTFRNVGVSYVEDRAGIKVKEARNCLIEGNRFENTFFAVYLAQTADCRVADNEMVGTYTREAASGNGVHLWYCKNITIENNRIHGHRDGIYMEFVEDSVIRGNESWNNLRYGLHFMFSDRCRYEQNVFRENRAGVAVMYTDHVEMVGNTFERNWGGASYGLLLKEIRDSRIEGNRFVKNTTGLYAESVNRTTVESNTFDGNGWAVKLMSSSQDNRFFRNNFFGNSFDVSTSSRRTSSTFEENYWDRYEGYDLDRDGFGDVPFHPVRLFSLIVEQNEPALVLMRSLFIDLLDAAERVFPVLTPETLVDASPKMKPYPDRPLGSLFSTTALPNHD
ncbi:nitrous oxide reductase family maturation protein NosD [Rhodocaloribacter sp.]